MRSPRVGLDPLAAGSARARPRDASFSQSGGEFMGVEEIVDLTKGVRAGATDRVPNRDADGERYQFLPPFRSHDPMVPRADHRPAQGSGTQAQDRS